eukprot:5441897-Prymnesium_polylepis.2
MKGANRQVRVAPLGGHGCFPRMKATPNLNPHVQRRQSENSKTRRQSEIYRALSGRLVADDDGDAAK